MNAPQASQGYPAEAQDVDEPETKKLSEAQVLKRTEALFAHLTPRAQSRVLSYLMDKSYEAQCNNSKDAVPANGHPIGLLAGHN